MEAEEILATARTGNGVPDGWSVFPLLRDKVTKGILSWIFGILLGVALLAFTVPIVVPYNYQRGIVAAIVTTFLLGIFAFVAVGCLYLLITDARRLKEAGKHVIVITESAFVKQEGDKILYVPLAAVRHVTPRGKPAVDRSLPSENEAGLRQVTRANSSVLSFFMGQNATASSRARRKRMRTPTSLSFLDVRDDSEVTVVKDDSYGDPFMIAEVLKEYTTASM